MKKINNKVAVIAIAVAVLVGAFFLFSNSNKDTDSDILSLPLVQSDNFYNGQPSLGDENAPVKVVKFGDFKCPACKAWEDTVYPKLKEKYIDEGIVEFYFVNLAFLGPDSLYAAEVGEAVAAQSSDAFFKYYEAVYANQQNESETWATEEYLFELIQNNVPEVDLDQLKQDIDAKTYEENVQSDIEFAVSIGLNSVPSVFVDGRKMEDSFDMELLDRMIEYGQR